MYRKIVILSTILILAFALFTPAQAISYGVPDGNGHPNVGAIVLQKGGTLYQLCTGTLISQNVFLTCAHCTEPLDWYENQGYEILVTFDPTITPGGIFYTGVWHTNPNYSKKYGNADPGDIAVIVLDQSPGITPASLPTEGLLDELKAQQMLYDTPFTAVGYGSVRVFKQTGWQAIDDTNTERRRAEQEVLALTNAWITLSMNNATCNGGTCYGDSGGPHFIHINGVETNIVAAITVTGDRFCKATDKDYRTDTESARNFLDEYVTLP